MAAIKSVFQHYDKSLYSLSEHNCCVTKTAPADGTVYGSNITPHDAIHHWQIKILKLHKHNQMFIGIHHANMKQLKRIAGYKMCKSISYGYGSDGRRFTDKGKSKKFGSTYHLGDIVHSTWSEKTDYVMVF
eukprot:367294_1